MVRYDAFERQTIADGITGGVSAMAWWCDMLYVGTHDGRLLLLSLLRDDGMSAAQPPPGSQEGGWGDGEGRGGGKITAAEPEVEISLGLGSLRVDQLVIVAAAGLVVARCAGRLLAHDLASLAPRLDIATALTALRSVNFLALRHYPDSSSAAGGGAGQAAGCWGGECRLCVATGTAAGSLSSRMAQDAQLVFFRLDDDFVMDVCCPLVRGQSGLRGGAARLCGGECVGVRSMAWWGDVVYAQFGVLQEVGGVALGKTPGGGGWLSSVAVHVPSQRVHLLGPGERTSGLLL